MILGLGGHDASPAIVPAELPLLITDGEQRAALALTRSLGRAGFPVFIGSAIRHPLASASRFARASALLPSPLTDPSGYSRAVERQLEQWRIRMLIPVTDASMLALLPRRRCLKDVTIPFGDAATHRNLSDKASLLSAAAELGIAVPRQRLIRDREESANADLGGLTFPVVLKPARSVAAEGEHLVKSSVGYAVNVAELHAHLRSYPAAAFPVLVQERIVGPGVGVFLLRWKGRTLATFSHRRLREKPPAGGVSVWCESIAADPRLVAHSTALLERFRWEGVAMVEYKYDAARGIPYLMEVNGRFWGSLQLAIDAGVDFPSLLVRAAYGDQPGPEPEYRVGVRMHSWWGSVDHVIARLRHSAAELALPPGAPSRARVVADLISLCAPSERGETLRADDPRPFARETIQWFTRQ
jgi:predicted ATP-grasp superfamily ATP-dependent carboligase